jgi:hypothetical protein
MCATLLNGGTVQQCGIGEGEVFSILDLPFGGKSPKAREPILWTDRRPTDQPLAEELKYSHDRALQHQRPTNNLLEVWQNLAIFGGRLIGSAVEVLLTKVVNR